MPFKRPKSDKNFYWTRHAIEKMRYYGLTESRLKKVLARPERTEVGVAPDTIAVMQTVGGKRKTEIWLMYQPNDKRKKIITAWRYPGVSPVREVPVPAEIKSEIL